MLWSNLILSQLLRQIRSRYHDSDLLLSLLPFLSRFAIYQMQICNCLKFVYPQILVLGYGGDCVTAVPSGDGRTAADGRNFDLLGRRNPIPVNFLWDIVNFVFSSLNYFWDITIFLYFLGGNMFVWSFFFIIFYLRNKISPLKKIKNKLKD